MELSHGCCAYPIYLVQVEEFARRLGLPTLLSEMDLLSSSSGGSSGTNLSRSTRPAFTSTEAHSDPVPLSSAPLRTSERTSVRTDNDAVSEAEGHRSLYPCDLCDQCILQSPGVCERCENMEVVD